MTRCWYLCWELSAVFWTSPAPAVGDGGLLLRNWSQVRSAGPECNRWHAAGFPSCSRSCSGGCWARAPSAWSSSRSCCIAGLTGRPRGSCSVRFRACDQTDSRCLSGKTLLGLLLSCWHFVQGCQCWRWKVCINARSYSFQTIVERTDWLSALSLRFI